MSPHDNVVPFPGSSEGPEPPDPRQLVEQLAKQALEEGMDPRELISAILSAAAPGPAAGWEQTLRTPEVGPGREDVVTYRVRVDLNGAKPPIWRRLELASDLPLDQLHEVLQVAMGWTNSHLHHFLMGPRFDRQIQPFLTEFDVEEGDEGILENDVRLDQVLTEVGDRFFYEYDFGDGWKHTIELEAITPRAEDTPRARLTGGRRACPPEDCGGIGGYAELLEGLAAAGPVDGWLQERLDWMPEGFDPEEFSVAETDALLQRGLSGSFQEMLSSLQGYSGALAELVSDCMWDPTSPLPELVAAAGLDDEQVPDADTRRQMLHPWLHLLELVGADGAPLTQAGYLKPEVVSRLSAELAVFQPWMGRGNREDHTRPVADLRSTATTMGLVRKHKGRLVLTLPGRKVAGDPDLLWEHLVGALPLGKHVYHRHAGVVTLLALAAGEEPGAGVRRHGPRLLEQAGWTRNGGPIDEWTAYHAARPTLEAIELIPGSGDHLRGIPPDEIVRQLARAALRTG